MYKDFTLKAKITDIALIEHKLRSIKARFIGIDQQTDYYFKIAKGKLKWRQGIIENLITHYERFDKPDMEMTLVYRYDVNPNQQQIDQLINNHEKIGEVKKERAIYKLDNIKIHIDKFKTELFIEIEAIDTSNKFSEGELRQLCLKIKSNLSIGDEQLVKTGYFAG